MLLDSVCDILLCFVRLVNRLRQFAAGILDALRSRVLEQDVWGLLQKDTLLRT